MLPQLLAAYYKARYRIRRFRRIFSVRPDELVLDIGAGDSPFAPADVICEKFPWDDTERTAGFEHDRPLVVGDVEALPFRDKAFDFIYCSHVLEHTFHPDRAIAELMRVGKRGYIEMPNWYLEKAMQSNPSHTWFVREEKDGQIVFAQKPKGILDPELNEQFERLHTKDPLFDIFLYGRLYELFHLGIFWTGEIRYRLIKNGAQPDDRSVQAFEKGKIHLSLDQRKPSQRKGLARLFKNWIRRRRFKKSLRVDDIIACPICRSTLNRDQRLYRCAHCDARFPIQNDIPILLREAVIPLETTSR